MSEHAERLFNVPTLTPAEAIECLDLLQAGQMASLAFYDRKSGWSEAERAAGKRQHLRNLAALDMARDAVRTIGVLGARRL